MGWEEFKQSLNDILSEIMDALKVFEDRVVEKIQVLEGFIASLDERVTKLENVNPEPPTPEPTFVIPEDHQKVADKVKCYYPWKDLRKVCVWVGNEEGKWSETCWLWIFDNDEKGSSDVALVMTIIKWDTYYSLEFGRMDGTDGEKATVEVEGYGKYENIFDRPETQKGYWGIPVNPS